MHASTHWYRAADRWTVPAMIVGIAAVLVSTACSSVRIPVGPGEEAPETAFSAHQEATDRFCSFPGITERATITAAMAVRGTSSGRLVRGRVWVGVDPRYHSLRIESAEGVPPHFILTSESAVPAPNDVDADATLFFPRDGLIVHQERSRALIESVLGLPLSAPEFVRAFTGCGFEGGELDMRTFGPNLIRMSIGPAPAPYSQMVLRRRNSRSSWTLATMTGRVADRPFRWRAEYDRSPESLSRAVRIASQEDSVIGRLFDLHLSLSRIQVAPLVGSEVFTPTIPRSARQVSLEAIQRQRSQLLLPLSSVR